MSNVSLSHPLFQAKAKTIHLSSSSSDNEPGSGTSNSNSTSSSSSEDESQLQAELAKHKKDLEMAKELYDKLKTMKASSKEKLKRKKAKKAKTASSPPEKKQRQAGGEEKKEETKVTPPAQPNAPKSMPIVTKTKDNEIEIVSVEEKPKRPTQERKAELELKISEKEKDEIEGKAAPTTSAATAGTTINTGKLDTNSPFYEERRKAYRFVASAHAPFHSQHRQLCDDTHKKLELCREFNLNKCNRKVIAHTNKGNPRDIVTHFCEVCVHALMVLQAHPVADCPLSRKRRAA